MIPKIILSTVVSASLVFVSPDVFAIRDQTTDANVPAPRASASSTSSTGSESESLSHSQASIFSQADDIRDIRASLSRLEAGLKQDRSDNLGLRYFQYWAGSFATVSLVLLVILQAASHIK